jgi:hypothetical protein
MSGVQKSHINGAIHNTQRVNPRIELTVLYTPRLWRKEIERFLSGFGRLAAQAISGNCFVNSIYFSIMNKTLILAAVIAAAALAACGKKEEAPAAAPAAAEAPAAAAPAASEAPAAAAPAAAEASK